MNNERWSLFHFFFFPTFAAIRFFSIFFRRWANLVAGLRAVCCRPLPAIVTLLDLYVGYPFATGFVFRSKSSVRQQYQLATEA